jgi:hypothetical protein
MLEKRVKVNNIIQSQLPEFVRSEFPLVSEFLKQYYISIESNGNPYDLMNNIDQYVKVDNLANLINSTSLSNDITFLDSTITVESTAGFVDNYGLIQINDEIILYESKTNTTFNRCRRGFSGVTSYNSNTLNDELEFSSSSSNDHSSGDTVINLNAILLTEFFNKIKKQITPGFEDRDFYSELNERLFVKQSNNFYTSKGTKESFRILFGALYGKPVEVILPRDYVFEPSEAKYRITKDLVVEAISGDPNDLLNRTLYQDKSNLSQFARGTVTGVEKITRNNTFSQKIFSNFSSPKSNNAIIKEYYIISLDFDYDKDIETRGTTVGNFTIHPKTKLVSTVSANQTYLDVDSTIGFPDSGDLIVDLPDGVTLNIEYKSKTINQFLECSGINLPINDGEEVKYDDYAYSTDSNGNQISVRITGVISSSNIERSHNLLESGNTIKLKGLGKFDSDDLKLNNWFFNVPSNYKVKSIFQLDPSNFSYQVETYDDNDFKIGNLIYLVSSTGIITPTGRVLSIKNNNIISIIGQGRLETISATGDPITYTIHRKVSKVFIKENPELSIYNADVSNVYYDKDDESIYITSPSLPNYGNQSIRINDLSLNIESFSNDIDNNGFLKLQIINFSEKHSFLTGDLVILKLNDENNTQIVGYVKVLSNVAIKLSKNKESILSGNFLDFLLYETSFGGKIELFKFNSLNQSTGKYESKSIQPQNIIRQIKNPESYGDKEEETKPGTIGLFLNGVEIQNYKSEDTIYYGKIESIDILEGGIGYDVINPPIVEVSDSIGTGFSGLSAVKGSLEKIDIIYPGFNFLDTPKIEIRGGNGSGAKAEASLVLYDYKKTLGINTFTVNNNEITFDSPHNFSTSEEIIYESGNSKIITGLSTNSNYYVSVVGINTIKLCSSPENAYNGINLPISVSGNYGNQTFRSSKKKRKIGSINIIDFGSGYTNKKIFAYASKSGISTSLNKINIKNHGFNTGEIISYIPESIPIGGLTTSNYYVGKLDEDSFRLYEISNINSEDFNLKTNQYVNLTSFGGEVHQFKYPDIEVNVIGTFEVPSLNTSSSEFNASLQPYFRGSLDSIFITDNGSNYGDPEIINFKKQPSLTLNSGSGGEIDVIIQNGRIISAYVKNSGFGYNSTPNIIISGDGSGAKLTPIIDSGLLVGVNVISSGIGYTKKNTNIDVVSAGSGSKVFFNITPWTINLPKRIPSLVNVNNISNINPDDGCITIGKNGQGIQYTHIYASRFLRSISNASKIVNGEKIYVSDIESDDLDNPVAHSPIIGWAYDGNPIYGPYAYKNRNGTGGIKKMISGYIEVSSQYRPSGYPLGFFVEDYIYNKSENSDLDKHNGRFCVTPEYPNGTYAYFTTISSLDNAPVFPYLIGNTFKSKSIKFNYNSSSYSNIFNINKTNWYRNTYPYNLSKKNSSYDYFLNSSDLEVDSNIQSTFSGTIKSIEILNSGDGYKVGEKVEFNNNGSYGSGASAYISKIKGTEIVSVSSTSISLTNIELEKVSNNYYIGYSTTPHNISLYEKFNITSKNEKNQYAKVGIVSNTLSLSVGFGTIGETGISTYIYVSGDLNSIRENDFYKINTEEIKVIDTDIQSSRLRILRSQNETNGLSSHFSGEKISELSRKLSFNFAIDNSYRESVNKQIYFNPSESVGIGTSFGVGITSTLYFSNPGVGKTLVTIPTRSLYLKDHGLESGDLLLYNTNGGSPIEISTNSGITVSNLDDNSEVFTYKISNDLIGITTNPVGLNSGGNISGISTIPSDLLYFIGIGTGTYHSFSTLYDDVLECEIYKTKVNVSIASSNKLSILDNIDINVDLNNERVIIVKYNDYNRRIIIDPLPILSVNVSNNSLLISNNKFKYGEKIIFEETSPISGLSNNGIYYISPINLNEFRLCESKYNLENNIYVQIESIGSGYISKINPEINIVEYQKIIFDLSDSSLSYSTGGASRKSSFDFNIYFDKERSNPLPESINSDVYKLYYSGQIGVSPDAKITLEINKNTPKKLYYNLIPILSLDNKNEKKEIVIDNEQVSNNQINLIRSAYNGSYNIIGISSTSFTYELDTYPESDFYSQSDADLSYKTNSISESGPISDIVVSNKGRNYKKLPNLSINSANGEYADIVATSDNIGSINKVNLESIGYNYSIDNTIRPIINIPSVLNVSIFSVFDKIEVVDKGFSYTSNTDLAVIDGISGKIVNDTKLIYDVNNYTVNVVQNTDGISSVIPKIVPINNPNGFEVKGIVFDSDNQTVTVELKSSFSDPEDFPFNVGTKILLEGFYIEEGDPGLVIKNYNSSEFDYALFEIVSSDSNLGGIGATITYSVADYINEGETFGQVNFSLSNARVVPEIYFPKFNVLLKKRNFITGERIYSGNKIGFIESWSPNSGTLTVATSDKFKRGDLLTSETTSIKAYINESIYSEGFYVIESNRIKERFWNSIEKGFLNNSLQRLHDNDYYQYFSYDLKSEVSIDKWEDPVSSLNHTAGFKKFSTLNIDSTNDTNIISVDQNNGNISAITNINSIVSTDCVYNFDLARENSININDSLQSNQILFNSRIIQDYIQSFGNKVLIIDDISDQFDNQLDSFELLHEGNPIFKRYFDGDNSDIVSINDDTINIPNHFFVTGEEIFYNSGGISGQPIGIATTTIAGIGLTDKLPETLYVVKIDDLNIRVSGSSTDALKSIPKYLDITSTGISTDHYFLSKKQNSKCLITVDNIIQSPIVSTAKTTLLSSPITTSDDIIVVDDPTQFVGGNLLKIDNEIIRILVVGYNSNDNEILVERSILGSVVDNHSAGALIIRVDGNYNIVDNTIYFSSPPNGKIPTENLNDPEEVDYEGLKISSTFSGRVFFRSGIEDTDITPYDTNYVFDSISDQFNGINNTFNIESEYQNVTGISTNNSIVLIRNIFQLPNRNSSIPIVGSYDIEETSGITSITFTGNTVQSSYDINSSSVPRGGIILSVGSTNGFGYQPLVSAGGTAIISGLGTIQSISIGNSGSGYRSGIQTTVNVSVSNTSIIGPPNYEKIGVASISNGNIVSVTITNPGSGYTSSNPPQVLFDSPLSYSNIPLLYSSSSQSGIGTEATVDLIVSQDSSILSFEIKNYGYGYNVDDILTIPIGGEVGIPTNNLLPFNEFQLFVDGIYDDQSSMWHLGRFTIIDPIDDLIDGKRKSFPIRIDGVQTSIESSPGSNINLSANLLIFINDILQIPGESYTFSGGSAIEFINAPQSYSDLSSGITRGTKTKILFYEGTFGIDTKIVDILETVKVGDSIRLDSDNQFYKQSSRLVNEIISSDSLKTNTYTGNGISEDELLLRNVVWCKQKNDIFLSSASFTGVGNSTRGFKIYKSRESYEPYINPSAYLIKKLLPEDNDLFVDNLNTFFNSFDEIGTGEDQRYKIISISSQDTLVSCSATAVVSSGGTITSIIINDPGEGYSSTPSVYISSPIGFGTTAIATATLSGSKVSTISVINEGSGYNFESPPSVLIEPPYSNFEKINKVSYEGDFGIVTGIETTTIGIGSTGLIFDFYISENSYNRDIEINPVGSSGTISGIQTGYYFVIKNSNIGYGLNSLDSNGQIIGIGTTFIDNVYQVSNVSIAQTTVTGIGTTTLARVTVLVSNYNGLSGIGKTYFYGEYSWGRISNLSRPNPKQFDVYINGITGISSSPVVQRYQPLKNKLYLS